MRPLRHRAADVTGATWRRHAAATVMTLTLVMALAGCDLPPGDDAAQPPAPAEATGPGEPPDNAFADDPVAVPDTGDTGETPSDDGVADGTSDPAEAPAAPAADGPVGFASLDGDTTGGAEGDTVAVDSADEFLEAIAADGPAVVQLDGAIAITGMHDVASDKTIEGGTISGGGLTLSGVDNVIVRDVTFTGADDDAINIEQGSTNIWIDHNDFSAGADGLLDIKRGSDLITVSWNHFHDHDKTALLGHSDDNASQDEGRLRVTYHHNWFDHTGQRHPRVRFGDPVHVFNNYYDNVGSYGIASTMEAGVVAEGNYFVGADDPIVTQTGDSDEGNVVERNNVYDGSGAPETRGTAEEPGDFYTYTVDDPASIPDAVTAGAGPR